MPVILLVSFLAVQAERLQKRRVVVGEEVRLLLGIVFMPSPAGNHKGVLILPVESLTTDHRIPLSADNVVNSASDMPVAFGQGNPDLTYMKGGEERHRMANVRYFVSDIEEAIVFYTQRLGFSLEENFGPFAIVAKEDLRLWLSDPRTSAARPCRTGASQSQGAGIAW